MFLSLAFLLSPKYHNIANLKKVELFNIIELVRCTFFLIMLRLRNFYTVSLFGSEWVINREKIEWWRLKKCSSK